VTATGLLDSWQDQGLVLGCWLVDNGRYLSGDVSWMKRYGSGRNTQRKEKRRNILDRDRYVTKKHNVRGCCVGLYFVY
jgi:hypothetical protein